MIFVEFSQMIFAESQMRHVTQREEQADRQMLDGIVVDIP